MNTNKRNRYFLSIAILFFYMLATSTSCHTEIPFVNCTNDTLFIGASHYNNIDSIDAQLVPDYYDSISLDTTNISLWEDRIIKIDSASFNVNAYKDCFIYPDSMCTIEYCYMNDKSKSDTTYFFLIKWSDAKRYSWDEIRENKLYRKWFAVRNKKGEFDRNIRYSDSDNQ